MEISQAPSGTADAVRFLARGDPGWLPVLWAAYVRARQTEQTGGVFAGAWVLDLLSQTAGRPMYVPGLRKLAAHGLLIKVDQSRGGRRAYYRMPDPDGVGAALRELGYPMPSWQMDWTTNLPQLWTTQQRQGRAIQDITRWVTEAKALMVQPHPGAWPPACVLGLPVFPPVLYQTVMTDVPDRQRYLALRDLLTQNDMALTEHEMVAMAESIVGQCDAGLERRLSLQPETT